jgi:hypothetical protein
MRCRTRPARIYAQSREAGIEEQNGEKKSQSEREMQSIKDDEIKLKPPIAGVVREVGD